MKNEEVTKVKTLGPIRIEVSSCDDGFHAKCPRCWHWHDQMENFGHLPEEIAEDPKLAKERLCDRCSAIMVQNFPEHPAVPHMLAALRAQNAKGRK